MTEKKISERLAARAGKRVLVVGDVILDEYLVGGAYRISPEAPVPVVELRETRHILGGAANAANNVRALGVDVCLAGVVGDDDKGRVVRRLLAEQGLADGTTVDPGRPTTTKIRVIAGGQQVGRVDDERRHPIPGDVEDRIVAWIRALDPAPSLVLLSDYAKGVLTPRLCRALVEDFRGAGVPVVVDPKGGDFSKYRGVSLVTPNEKEGYEALGEDPRASALAPAAVGARLAAALPGTAILMTRGPDGMSLFAGVGEPEVHIAAEARSVFDVTGAGDTVAAALAVALACGLEIAEAAAVANVAAGIVVAKRGTATVSFDELRRELDRGRGAR